MHFVSLRVFRLIIPIWFLCSGWVAATASEDDGDSVQDIYPALDKLSTEVTAKENDSISEGTQNTETSQLPVSRDNDSSSEATHSSANQLPKDKLLKSKDTDMSSESTQDSEGPRTMDNLLKSKDSDSSLEVPQGSKSPPPKDNFLKSKDNNSSSKKTQGSEEPRPKINVLMSKNTDSSSEATEGLEGPRTKGNLLKSKDSDSFAEVSQGSKSPRPKDNFLKSKDNDLFSEKIQGSEGPRPKINVLMSKSTDSSSEAPQGLEGPRTKNNLLKSKDSDSFPEVPQSSKSSPPKDNVLNSKVNNSSSEKVQGSENHRPKNHLLKLKNNDFSPEATQGPEDSLLKDNSLKSKNKSPSLEKTLQISNSSQKGIQNPKGGKPKEKSFFSKTKESSSGRPKSTKGHKQKAKDNDTIAGAPRAVEIPQHKIHKLEYKNIVHPRQPKKNEIESPKNGARKVPVPKEKLITVTCITDYVRYCRHKFSGYKFQDGCRNCRCRSLQVNFCEEGPCLYHVPSPAGLASYCEVVKTRNEQSYIRQLKRKKVKYDLGIKKEENKPKNTPRIINQSDLRKRSSEGKRIMKNARDQTLHQVGLLRRVDKQYLIKAVDRIAKTNENEAGSVKRVSNPVISLKHKPVINDHRINQVADQRVHHENDTIGLKGSNSGQQEKPLKHGDNELKISLKKQIKETRKKSTSEAKVAKNTLPSKVPLGDKGRKDEGKSIQDKAHAIKSSLNKISNKKMLRHIIYFIALNELSIKRIAKKMRDHKNNVETKLFMRRLKVIQGKNTRYKSKILEIVKMKLKLSRSKFSAGLEHRFDPMFFKRTMKKLNRLNEELHEMKGGVKLWSRMSKTLHNSRSSGAHKLRATFVLLLLSVIIRCL